MTEPLFTMPPGEHTLTERQRLTLAAARGLPGGVSADDAGAALHALRWTRGGRQCSCCLPAGVPCAWAEDAGREVLQRLRELGYGLVRRKTGRWEVPGTTPKPTPAGMSEDIPY